MNFLQGISVLVLGLGESGLAMARWCASCGADVRVWDSRDAPPLAAALAEHVPAAVSLRGPLVGTSLDDALADAKLVLKSPGLAPSDERIAPTLARAASTGIPVWTELDLFARALADLKAARGYAPKLLAVTGTNGKTTTTAMTAQLVARTGKRVAVAGNIGPTMLQTLADALALEPVEVIADVVIDAAVVDDVSDDDADIADDAPIDDELLDDNANDGTVAVDDIELAEDAAEAVEVLDALSDDAPEPVFAPPPVVVLPVFGFLPEVWVLELSSFQLDGVRGFEPDAATVLNITQDHLDWHGDMAHYADAKARVFGTSAVMVINREDAAVEALLVAAQTPPSDTRPLRGGRPRKVVAIRREVVRFGTDAPRRPGDFGLVTENGMTWLVRAREVDETFLRARRKPARALAGDIDAEDLQIQRLMPADALRVRGRHNASNALAALALATAIGCPLAPMLHALRDYAGEPHRVEYIATLDGVDAFDDSKGTNVGATVAALEGLGADKSPAKLVVILGGDGKGQDFAPLAEPVRRHARAVALIGRDAAEIETALADTGVPLQRLDTLEAATRWCFERAHSGDAVLLSPACASLDMFRNYGHRAQVFVEEVRTLVADRGGIAA